MRTAKDRELGAAVRVKGDESLMHGIDYTIWVRPRIDASTETHIFSLDSGADDGKMYRSGSATWSGAGVKR
jgi:hypothetical protein